MRLLAFATLAAMSLGLLGACDRQPERPAQLSLQTSFDSADKNRDGVIARSEATHIANREFAEVDTDHNQFVNLDEFRVAMENPAPPRG